MKHEQIIELLRHIENASLADRGSVSRFVALIKNLAPTFYHHVITDEERKAQETSIAIPSLDRITAAQLTLFDNWQPTGGRKPKRHEKNSRSVRFKCVLEVWTTAPEVALSKSNCAGRVTFNLMDHAERAAKMAEYANPRKSKGGFVVRQGEAQAPEWEAFSNAVISAPADTLCGPAYTKADSGTLFVLDCMAVMTTASATTLTDDMEIIVSVPSGGFLRFHGFADTTAGRKPLSGNAVRSSRLAPNEGHPAWRTGVIYRPVNQEEPTEDDCPY